MMNFIFELFLKALVWIFVEIIFSGIFWLLRSLVLLILYPVMLLSGWIRLWVRKRGKTGFMALWQAHGHSGLHRFGWQEAALDAQYLGATLLIALGAGGVGLVIWALYTHWLA